MATPVMPLSTENPATAFSGSNTVHANQLFINDYGPGAFWDLVFY